MLGVDAINATGNSLINDLRGNDANNIIDGLDGYDDINGFAGDDTLYGGHGNDEIYGGLGNDTIDGGLGDDTLCGGDGNDEICGSDGNDSITGGCGDDILIGGSGEDTAFFSDSYLNVLITYLPDTDAFSITTPLEGTDTLHGIECFQFKDKQVSASTCTLTDDYSDNTSTQGRLVSGQPVVGNIDYPDDIDWFRSDLITGMYYRFELLGSDGGGGTLGSSVGEAFLMLYDSSGYIINVAKDGGSGGDPLIYCAPAATGAYYLSAREHLGVGTGTYTIKTTAIVDDHSNDTATKDQMPIDHPVTGTIEYPCDQDCFKVDLMADITYVFELLAADGGGGTLESFDYGGAHLLLYNTNGYVIGGAINGGTGGDPLMSYTPALSGTYYIAADSLFSDGTGTYTLKATSMGTSVDDYSDNTSTTGQVIVGHQVTGNIEFPNDKDWFKLELTAETTYRIELLGAKSGYGTLGSLGSHAYFSLYNPDCGYIGCAFNGSMSGEPMMFYKPSVSGTYYLEVKEASNPGAGTYTLKADIAEDFIAPEVVAFEPVTGATGVAVDADIILTFSEDIQRGSGDVILMDAAGAVSEMFNAADSNRLSISGSILTIDPSTSLENGTHYYVTFNYGTIRDLAGIAFAGTAYYDFTTIPNLYPGTKEDDTIAGSAGNDLIDGDAGNDILYGRGGDDTLRGGEGIDTAVLKGIVSQYEFCPFADHPTVTGPDGVDSLIDVEYIRFGSSSFTTDIPLSEAATTAPLQIAESITDLYVAYFNRGPDPEGFDYWFHQIYTGETNLRHVAQDFWQSDEARSMYPDTFTNRQFVERIYQNLFDREPDQGGWDFWTNHLDLDHLQRSGFILDIIQGAYSPTSGPEDRTLIDNKHTVSLYYTGLLANNPQEGFDFSIADLLNRVNGNTETIAAAVRVIDCAFDDAVTLTGVMTDQNLLDSLWMTA